jgi:hypothetical protein
MTGRRKTELPIVLIAMVLVASVVSLAACQPQKFRQPRHEPAAQPLKPG